MGFFSIATEVILQEHKFRPITGRVLMIGRQNTGLTPPEALHMIERLGIEVRRRDFEIDTKAMHSTRRGEITDRSFFAAFADCRVEAIDVSAYEGAEIIHDLSTPVPDDLKDQFDFIFDGSTLDNVFNAAIAMQNIHDLLKPHGRCVMINWSNSTPSAYSMLSPDWFMDFFAYHEYEDARVLVVEAEHPGGRVWQYNPFKNKNGYYGYQRTEIITEGRRATVCFGEKSDRPPKSGYTVQNQYRSEKEPYLSSAIRFHNSRRPAYDFHWHGAKTDTPNISAFETLSLLADSARQSEPTEIKRGTDSLRYRIQSALREGRVISGIKRRLT